MIVISGNISIATIQYFPWHKENKTTYSSLQLSLHRYIVMLAGYFFTTRWLSLRNLVQIKKKKKKKVTRQVAEKVPTAEASAIFWNCTFNL